MRHLLATLLILAPLTVWAEPIWDGAGYEADPANIDPVSSGDDEIREQKGETRFRLEVEHNFGSDNTDDNGQHEPGSARCFMADAAPTAIVNADYDNTVGTSGSGTATLTDNSTNNADTPVQKVGQARCWIDTDGADNTEGTADDNELWVFDQDPNGDGNTADAAWVNPILFPSNTPFTASSGVRAGNQNLIRNGGFELGDDGGADPDPDPTYWTSSGTDGTTPAYTITPVSEGGGKEISIVDDGTGGATLTQTLDGDGLKANQRYYVVARYEAAVGDTCRLTTTGGSTNVSDSGTSTSYDSLTGEFVTDGIPANVAVVLETVAASDACRFDRVGVFEINEDGVPSSNPAPATFDTDTNTPSADPFEPSPSLTSVDSNNCAILVLWTCTLDIDGGPPDMELTCTLEEEQDNSGSWSAVGIQAQVHSYSLSPGAVTIGHTATGFYINENPTPGVTYAYRAQLAESGVTRSDNDEQAIGVIPICPGS